MSKDLSRKRTFVILGIVFLAGIAFAGLFNSGLAFTNQEEFCTDCHTMQIPFRELQESAHYKNASGVGATCANCHVPEPFFPKLLAKLIAAKDVYHELVGTIDTPEKYEARRWEMASRVWAKLKATDSRECRSCHDFRSMDLTEQDRSARSKHGNAEDKGQTCIDCHKGVAHEEPDAPETIGDAPDSDAT
ncbi:NapC/NirT family cytochrome c [Candidatus Thiosymbion oneisti]|uniref:NapC/NirT family cytochrome c n=1 Tax=Candidatus Thiosymbion oneisti TaxID=589554 RepID=UPI0010622BC5|nr:NapC/NirT family cytochrome c [Candidatus Thiosymbion oneisti]